IGKTRLAEEIAALARGRGARVAMGRCGQAADAPALWPWRTILRELGAPEDVLVERPGEEAGDFARFVAVADRLRGAEGGPLVIVIDGAERADTASLLLAQALIRESAFPLLILLTVRRPASSATAVEAAALLAELGREGSVLTLGGLSEDDVADALAASGAPAPDPELVAAVTAITKGVPLLLRSVLVPGGGHLESVPHGLERVIEDALARLPETDRKLVGLAALLGREASVHEVAAIGCVSPVVAAEALARAAASGLLRDAGALRYAFVHEPAERLAAASAGRAGALDGHGAAAAARTGPEPERVARRAHHALAAAVRSSDDATLAVAIAREAAGSLMARDRFEAASALLARAAEIQAAA